MPRSLFLLFACVAFFTAKTVAQPAFSASIPFEFTSEEDNRLIKDNDSLKYYEATGDTDKIVCLDEEASYYKLLGKDHKVIAEGAFILEGEKYLQVGKWSEHFPNGKVKMTGYYEKSKPVGTWQEFYNTGKLKTVCNYVIINDRGVNSGCAAGAYQEFYPSGRVKMSGFYGAVSQIVTDTSVVEDPIAEKKIMGLQTHNVYVPEKIGRWEYYNEDGELEKKEDL